MKTLPLLPISVSFMLLFGCSPKEPEAVEEADSVEVVEAAPVHPSIDEAIARGEIEQVRAIIAADPKALNEGRNPNLAPLLSAILRKKTEIALLLIESGADVNAQDPNQRSAPHLAVERNLPELVQPLADAGASLQELDSAGWTPLHWATAKDNFEMTKALVDSGADIHKLSIRGGTILHEAASSGSPELVQYLLDLGVDPAIKANDGSTALSVASEFKNTAAVAILSKL